ncbi:MAG: GNAT family N-acetyltransferase [Candidatus Thorarchaeota archaeon]
MNIQIKALTPDILDDFLYFFDNIAFSDNPDWATCYCHFYHFKGKIEEFFKRTAEENRKSSQELIISGKMKGFLAYLDNKVVGWCNANSKENYAKIPFEEESKYKIISIICFVIAPLYRKQGIARSLLKHVLSYYKEKNYDLIEVYPRKGDLLSDAHSYRGPKSLYTSEGFSTYREFRDHYVMHKNL